MAREMSEKVTLEISLETAKVISHACEFFMRMRNGQFSELSWEFVSNPHKHGVPEFDSEVFNSVMYAIREMIFPDIPRNAHYGINHDVDGDIAYDVHEVLRHAIAMHEKPEGGITVDFRKPMGWSKEPLPKCRIEEKK